MWTAQLLEERQRLRRQQQQQSSGPPPAPPPSTALPLRRDQTVRLNRWLSAKAAADGHDSFEPLPELATASELATHPSITMPLLDAVGASLAMLLAAGIEMPTLKSWGVDALYVAAHPHATAQLVNSHGRAMVAQSLLHSSSDAVLLAGTAAATTLGISTKELLRTVVRGVGGRGNVRTEATTILDQERSRHAFLLAEALRMTGRPAALRPEQAMLQGVTVTELANAGLDAQLLTQRYKLTLDELGRCLGVRALCEMAAIGVVVV